MVIENDSHTVKELVEIGMPKECAAILCKLPYDTFVFEINGDKITAVPDDSVIIEIEKLGDNDRRFKIMNKTEV